jgi:hypothetical protein
LMAAYSPPIPAPVQNRMKNILQKSQASPVRAVAMRYTARVVMKSFFRPSRSVR